MKVSVVIPVYNVKPYLERCVQSVFFQTFNDLEIILVDDGSTDGSGELCDEITKWASYIHVIHQPNQGLSAARNAGINHAQGDYIAFLDSDDMWLLDNGLETILKTSGARADLILFKSVDIWRNNFQTHEKDYDSVTTTPLLDAKTVFTYLVMTQQFRASSCFLLVRRQLLLDNDIFFALGYISEDVQWSLLLWQHAKTVTFVNLEFYGYFHRINSISQTPSLYSYECYDKMFSYWKEQCNGGCVNAVPIRFYLAELWVSKGYGYFKLSKTDKKKALNILNRHSDLLDYASSTKSKRAKTILKIAGIRTTVIALGLYWRIRTTVKRHFV